jgi:DNA-binding NtrC family response regulator
MCAFSYKTIHSLYIHTGTISVMMVSPQFILVVDDDEDIVRIVRLGLENAGFQVHAFTDPILALQHVEQGCKQCEVLVSDIRMPKMNGFELVKRIRQIKQDMKLIMMTAFEVNKKEFESIFPSTTIDNLITKPFPLSKLISMIQKMTASEVHEEQMKVLQAQTTKVI